MKLKWWYIGLLLCLAVAIISPLASSSPDGLEKVAEDKGFIKEAKDAPFEIIADYVFPGVGNEKLATILAGLVGTLLIFGIVYGGAKLLKASKKEVTTQPAIDSHLSACEHAQAGRVHREK